MLQPLWDCPVCFSSQSSLHQSRCEQCLATFVYNIQEDKNLADVNTLQEESGKLKAKVEAIASHHRQHGTMFEDPGCPPYYTRRIERWRRLYEIFNFNPQLVHNEPKVKDIRQSAIANCWFVSTLCAIANRPHLIDSLIITADPFIGIYGVRLCVDGIWQYILVDDRVPCTRYGSPVTLKVRNNLTWPYIIEKAYAKISGSYEGMSSGGVFGLSMSYFTGFAAKFARTTGFESLTKERMFTQIQEWYAENFPMNATTGNQPRTVMQDYNIFPKHAYNVLDVRNFGEGRCLIKLRDVNANLPWLGDWNEHDPKWDAVSKEALHDVEKGPNNEGEFWISLDDFYMRFWGVEACIVRTQWYEHAFYGSFYDPAIKTISPTLLTVTQPTTIDVFANLHHYGKKLNAHHFITLLVIQTNTGRVKASTTKIEYAPSQSLTEHFDPGVYTIYVMSTVFMDVHLTGNIYTLRCLSELNQLTLRTIEEPTTRLRDALIALAWDKGQRVPLTDATILILDHRRYSMGAAIVANTSSQLSCGVKTQIAQHAVRLSSTRPAQTTFDKIPPRKIQITQVVSSEECNDRVRLGITIKLLPHQLPFILQEGHSPSITEQTENIHKPCNIPDYF